MPSKVMISAAPRKRKAPSKPTQPVPTKQTKSTFTKGLLKPPSNTSKQASSPTSAVSAKQDRTLGKTVRIILSKRAGFTFDEHAIEALESISPWWAQELEKLRKEWQSVPNIVNGHFQFELRWLPHGKVAHLKRSIIDDDAPVDLDSEREEDSEVMKLEDRPIHMGQGHDVVEPDAGDVDLGSATSEPATIMQSRAEKQAIFEIMAEAHRDILILLFHKDPSTTPDIKAMLSYGELLINVAQAYDEHCVKVVSQHLGTHLQQFRRGLFIAISADPPRWILLAGKLKNEPIFAEALVHCAGCYPCDIWPTKLSKLPADVVKMLQIKAQKLAAMRAIVNDKLHMIGLEEDEDGGNTHSFVTMEDSFRSWMVERLWDSWLKEQRRAYKESYDCSYYRAIHKGGQAFLDPEKTFDELMGNGYVAHAGWDLEAIAEELNTIKAQAQRLVAPLLKDNLTIEAESNGISYLTCTEVYKRDYPWTR